MRDVDQVLHSWAHSARRRYPELDAATAVRLAHDWVNRHSHKIDRWFTEDETPDGRTAWRRVERGVRGALEHAGRAERAYCRGYEVEDIAYYSTGMVEELLPVLFDPTLADAAPVTERAEVSGPNDPAIQPLWPIHVIDMRRAWEGADLTVRERGMLGMRYGDNASLADIARAYEVGESELERGLRRSLRRLVDVLGGESPRTCERDCQDCKS